MILFGFAILAAGFAAGALAMRAWDRRDTRSWVLPTPRVMRLWGNRRVEAHEDSELHSHERGDDA